MNASELKKFKKILLEKKKILIGNVTKMEDEALKGAGQDFSVDHMADYGSDNYEQQFTLSLIESEEEQLREIDAALERIDEKTFGDCERCETTIGVERLMAIPYARLCIQCKKEEEQQGSLG